MFSIGIEEKSQTYLVPPNTNLNHSAPSAGPEGGPPFLLCFEESVQGTNLRGGFQYSQSWPPRYSWDCLWSVHKESALPTNLNGAPNSAPNTGPKSAPFPTLKSAPFPALRKCAVSCQKSVLLPVLKNAPLPALKSALISALDTDLKTSCSWKGSMRLRKDSRIKSSSKKLSKIPSNGSRKPLQQKHKKTLVNYWKLQNEMQYKWVPLNPNMDNPNSQFFPSPMENTCGLCVYLPTWSEIWLIQRLSLGYFSFSNKAGGTCTGETSERDAECGVWPRRVRLYVGPA